MEHEDVHFPHLATARIVQVVTTGALVDMPGWQQAEACVSHIWQDVVIQILDLVEHVGMREHHALHQHIIISFCCFQCQALWLAGRTSRQRMVVQDSTTSTLGVLLDVVHLMNQHFERHRAHANPHCLRRMGTPCLSRRMRCFCGPHQVADGNTQLRLKMGPPWGCQWCQRCTQRWPDHWA